MKALVTGGAGFIGSHICDALVARGDSVVVLDNFATGREDNLAHLAGRIDLRRGDIRRPEDLASAVAGCDVVFHLAAMPSVPRSVEDPITSFDVNAAGTVNVLNAARLGGVRRVVYSASSSAYGDTPTLPKIESMPPNPLSPYAADKLHGENAARVFFLCYGLETVVLRYFNVFGPRQRPDSAYAAVIPKFTDAFVSGREPVIYGDGEQSRDFTYIANVVAANLLAASAPGAPGRVFNVGNGCRTTLNELLKLIAQRCGVPAKARYEAVRAGDVKHSLADIEAARSILGYDPPVDLATGLDATVKWFRAADGGDAS